MPTSVVIGGQFGSEGKGKVALEIVRRDPTVTAVVRVGGTNSGHTVIGRDGQTYAFRQFPAAALDQSVQVIFPPGSYIDPAIFAHERTRLCLRPGQVLVSPMARIITDEHKLWEQDGDLGTIIGSTQSGTGAAVIAMAARTARQLPIPSPNASEIPDLSDFLADTTAAMRRILDAGKRIVIEGTQGFGLSVLQGGYWPKATSRDTTAAAFLAEAGLSPLDVDDVTMVIRCHPIRVGGDSGHLPHETTWSEIAKEAGLLPDFCEYTTVTHRVRRVARFDAEIVIRAIAANNPTRVVLNHLDYVDPDTRNHGLTDRANRFVECVEHLINRKIDWLGIGPASLIDRGARCKRAQPTDRSVMSGPSGAKELPSSTFQLQTYAVRVMDQPEYAARAAAEN